MRIVRGGRELKYLKEAYPNATLYTANPRISDLKFHFRRSGGNLVTVHLSCSIVPFFVPSFMVGSFIPVLRFGPFQRVFSSVRPSGLLAQHCHWSNIS